MSTLSQFIQLLRVSHWTKSSFVLLGVFYSGSLRYLPKALLASLAFCFIASVVYIYNDINDKKEDKLHPYKRQRPLTSGYFSLRFAIIIMILLFFSGLLLAWWISSTLVVLLILYLLINLAYNHLIKNFPIADVLCIASGFMLRVLAGTIGIGLPISWWLTLISTLISLDIALCKRRLEKQLSLQYSTRAVLKKYSFHALDQMIFAVSLISFMSYFFYTLLAREQSFYFLLTLPFAALGLWRFTYLTTGNRSINDDPVSLFVNDHLSQINLLCFLFLTLIALFK